MNASGTTKEDDLQRDIGSGLPEWDSAGTTSSSGDRSRKVGYLLALGIAFLPGLFVWFLLRKGHSTNARAIGFGWAGLLILLSLTVTQIAPPPTSDAASLADNGDSPGLGARDAADGDLAQAEAGPVLPPAPVEQAARTEEPMDDEHRAGFHCLSPWDGSHGGLKDAVKDNLRNPDSFEHVNTVILPIDINRRHLVAIKYRAENGFGGMNVEEAVGMIDNGSCQLVKLQM